MTFKKDYIHYLLYYVLNGNIDFRKNQLIQQLVGKIRATDDIIRIIYLVGKTAGLEMLFKYLLYISDKIDKSQITIFNLKDNFDHDVHNLTRVFTKIAEYKSENAGRKIESIQIPENELKDAKEELKEKDRIKIDSTGSDDKIISQEIPTDFDEENTDDQSAPSLTLIENSGDGKTDAEVFELSEINDDIETTVKENTDEQSNISGEEEEIEEETAETEEVFGLENIEAETDETLKKSDRKVSETEENEKKEKIKTIENENAYEKEELPPVEIEVRKPLRDYEQTAEIVKEEAVTNEAYYKFESKFFEEVKILEKLFKTVGKERLQSESEKLSEKCLQCLSEIIEITSELSNLSRQLSFDLIADIFLTMNLYFTKSINSPEIITQEKIKLLSSSLALVNSLIKGEDYLNYDIIVDKIEILKNEMQRPVEEIKAEPLKDEELTPEIVETTSEDIPETESFEEETEQQPVMTDENKSRQQDIDSVNFKMRYLIKEFEKIFNSVSAIKGEYKRFDALDKIDELNNALRLIAKISASVKMKDVLKLAEVSYVFLKYLKDYRMDLLDAEIQQIIKYIIFTFKMLLTDRKPEDFNVLVQYLNNPVKIFADS